MRPWQWIGWCLFLSCWPKIVLDKEGTWPGNDACWPDSITLPTQCRHACPPVFRARERIIITWDPHTCHQLYKSPLHCPHRDLGTSWAALMTVTDRALFYPCRHTWLFYSACKYQPVSDAMIGSQLSSSGSSLDSWVILFGTAKCF